jgi:spore maturation protein CgeB
MKKPNIMIAGGFWHGSLEGSYFRAFENIGCQVEAFDVPEAISKYTKIGKIGQLFSTYLPIEAWINKANREFVVKVTQSKPDILIVGGASQIRVGALAQMKASVANLKIVLIWPDPMLRVHAHVINCLPIYDLIATYSNNTVNVFKILGAKTVEWVPFAADTFLHPANIEISDAQRIKFSCDICFIGNHRPEREKIFNQLYSKGYDVKVWGPTDWKRHATNYSMVQNYWQKQSLYGDDFARVIRCSKLSINPIDPTNLPSANMRFFEIPCAGGLQVCSPCPEMETAFKDGEAVFYYKTLEDLPRIIDTLLRDDTLRNKVAQYARKIVQRDHTYVHRAHHIFELLKLGCLCP